MSLNKLCFIICIALVSMSSCSKSPNRSYSFSNDSRGCGDFMVYKTLDDNTAITVIGSKEALDLSTSVQVFQLSNTDIQISIDEFDDTIGSYYCDDVVNDNANLIQQHFANSATVEIDVSNPNPVMFETYEITIRLKNVEFEFDGETVRYDEIVFEDVTVGWLPG